LLLGQQSVPLSRSLLFWHDCLFLETSLLAYCVVINATLACLWLCRRLEGNWQISIHMEAF